MDTVLKGTFRRCTLYLRDEVAELMQKMADAEQISVSQLASRLIERESVTATSERRSRGGNGSR